MHYLTRFSLRIVFLLFTIGAVIGGYVVYHLTFETLKTRDSKEGVSLLRLMTNYKRCQGMNTNGLAEANFSESGAPTLDYLKSLKRNNPNMTIISAYPGDFWYLEGRHLEFFCLSYENNTLSIIPQDSSFKEAMCRAKRFIYQLPQDISIVRPLSERTLLKDLEIPYAAPYTEHWYKEWGFINNILVEFEKIDSKSQHVHFHCEHGKGRTTLIAVLYDIFRNVHQVSVEDIMTRHFCRDGEDLMDTQEHIGGSWTKKGLENRRNIALAFYDYMKDPKGYGFQSWDEWLSSKRGTNYPYLPHKDGKNKHQDR